MAAASLSLKSVFFVAGEILAAETLRPSPNTLLFISFMISYCTLCAFHVYTYIYTQILLKKTDFKKKFVFLS